MMDQQLAPLSLKVGWTYRNRAGTKHRIVDARQTNDEEFFSSDRDLAFYPNGKSVSDIEALDLVEELYECHGLDTDERVCFYEQDFYVLSNFSSFTLNWKGIRFDTSEAAYHWEKFAAFGKPAEIRERIRVAASAHEAFQIAQEYKSFRRPDWDEVKVGIMEEILREKTRQHDYVKRKLLATDDRLLVENSWRDDFWGWGPNKDGQNMLGKLWMKIRADLFSEIPELPEFLHKCDPNVTIIKAPLPAGMKDTPEVRQRLTDLFRHREEDDTE